MDADSDDFVPDPPKVSRLTRKKKKKDTKPKIKTSSQVPSSEVAISRKSSSLFLKNFNSLILAAVVEGGRPARKSAEERRFERELEEAIRMSAEEINSSPDTNTTPVTTEVKQTENEAAQVSSRENLNRTPGNVEVKGVRSADTEPFTVEDQEDEDVVPRKKKFAKKLDSDDDGFEVAAKVSAVGDSAAKKRKVQESWTVSAELTKPREARRRKPNRKFIEINSDSESDNEEENDEEFNSVKSKKILLKCDNSNKLTEKKKLLEKPNKLETTNATKRVSRTLIPVPEIPLPNNKNIFQNKPSVTPRTVDSNSSQRKAESRDECPNPKSRSLFQSKVPVVPRTVETAGELRVTKTDENQATSPVKMGSISSLLKRFQSPASIHTSCPAPDQSPARTALTPAMRKLPLWTPPSKVGTSSPAHSVPSSPRLGYRVGLSRNIKSKPLHASVKNV